jgi:pseudouridine-5'-phosphate glycosidase/pseudouridine kinase
MIHDKQEDALSAPLEVLPDMIRTRDHTPPSSPTKLAVIGSAAVDITANAVLANSTGLGRHSTTPGTVSLTLGGVARNIAEAAHRVLASIPKGAQYPLLISPVGLDSFGKLLISETKAIGMRTDGVLTSSSDQITAVCNMILDNTCELMSGVADMGITETFGSEQVLLFHRRGSYLIHVIDFTYP